MLGKSIETDEIDKVDEMNQKKKIKLIIISKRGKSDVEKEKSKITFHNERGIFQIRMENMTQTLNKNKIDKAVKSIIKNISDFGYEKGKEKIYSSMENERKPKKKIIINNDNNNSNNYYNIYLGKKKKNIDKNKIIQKKEELEKDSILFKKINIIEKEKEKNLNEKISNNIDKNAENNIKINDEVKESNRVLLKKDVIEDGSMNYKLNTKREIESALGVSNTAINKIDENNNLYVNNYIQKDNNGKEQTSNLIENNNDEEENKNEVKIYDEKDKINNNNLINNNNNDNNLSRNIGRQLTPRQDIETYNQSTNNFNKMESNINDSKYKINLNYNSKLTIPKKYIVPKYICSICEITYTSCAYYAAECNYHFLCKKCAKSFYEEKIETGAKTLLCPFITCGKKFSKEQVKKFVSKKHYQMLEEEKNNLNSLALINSNNNKKIDNYTENHVIDINNNKNFYNYNKNKEMVCSKCNKESLFCREKQHFMRCLNCKFAQCKYCFKEYTYDHFDLNSKNYCRIYYRGDESYNHSFGKIIKFLIQLFLVFAIFFLSIISQWKLPKHIFTNLFFRSNNVNNCFLFYIKMIMIYLFTFIIFMICLPINIIMFPWFPSFLALIDY